MIIGETYKLIEKIGKGSYGDVYIVTNIKTNEFFAAKQVSKKILQETNKLYFNNEVYILKNLPEHPNLIKFYGIYETLTNYYVIMDFCNGHSLEEIIKRKKVLNKPFTEEECRYIIYQLLTAINILSKNNIIHRDIKCENVLLNYKTQNSLLKMDIMQANIKLIDFGFSRYIQKNKLAASIVGTPLFMDPYILNELNSLLENKKNNVNKYNKKEAIYEPIDIKGEKSFYDYRTDLWSVGIVMFEILFGHMPFNAKNANQLLKEIDKFSFYFPIEEKKKLSCLTVQFLNKLFIKDFRKRPFVEELLMDEWFKVKLDNDNEKRMELISMNERINLENSQKEIYFENFFKIIPQKTLKERKTINKMQHINQLLERIRINNYSDKKYENNQISMNEGKNILIRENEYFTNCKNKRMGILNFDDDKERNEKIDENYIEAETKRLFEHIP